MDSTNTETPAPVISLTEAAIKEVKRSDQRPGHHGRRAPSRRQRRWLLGPELHDQLRREDRSIRSGLRIRRRQGDR